MKQIEKNIVDFEKIFVKINLEIINYIYNYYNIENNINLNNTDFNKIFSHFFIDGIVKYYRNNPNNIIVIHNIENNDIQYYNNKTFLTNIKKLTKILAEHLCIPIIFTNVVQPYNKKTGEYKEYITKIQQQYNYITSKQYNYKKFKQYLTKKHLHELKIHFDNPKNMFFTK